MLIFFTLILGLYYIPGIFIIHYEIISKKKTKIIVNVNDSDAFLKLSLALILILIMPSKFLSVGVP